MKYKHITIERKNGESYKIIDNEGGDAAGRIVLNSEQTAYVLDPYPIYRWGVVTLRDIIHFIENHAGKEEK